MAVETMMGQKTSKLVNIAAAHVDPFPERDRLGLDARPRPASEQRHQCDSSSTGFIESGRLGRTGIHCRYRQTLGDVAERMGIADGKIVEPALNSRVASDREVRLVSLYV